MAFHNHTVGEKEFYDFWQGYKTAVAVPFDDSYKQWDSLILSCESPKWKNLPMYFKISFIEYIGMNETLLHLKK
jgi:hypothetical protein